MAQRPRRVDTHSHYLPDFYREELAKRGHANLDGMPGIPVSSAWSLLRRRAVHLICF